MTDTASPSRLTMTGVRKAFGPTQALAGVDLDVRPGEVHALIGENGAGKSTLMKVLSGALKPDAGTMHLDGRPYRPMSPLDARRQGIAMIYQELNLALDLTVEDNLLLGTEGSAFGVLKLRGNRRRVLDALAQIRHPEIQPETPIRQLSIGAQQLVEVARALMTDARIIVMDEPTSALARENVEHLFDLIRRMRDRGVSIVYISHFLEEVRAVADRFTVLRDGLSVGTSDTASANNEAIIEMMVGRKLDEMFPHIPHERGDLLLDVENLSGTPSPDGVHLQLHRGEILGLAGLIGAGRTELLRTLFGLAPVREGRVRIAAISGRSARSASTTPARRIRQSVGLLSEDRKEEGLALNMSIADNMTLSRLDKLGRWGVLDLGRQERESARWVKRLTLRCEGPHQSVWNLSGGNQQKVAIARLLHQDADILLLDEPTRGIDVGAKVQIFQLMGELASAGKGILFVSSYLPELMGVCDRIGVMRRGRLVEIREREAWTEHEIMSVATGSEQSGGGSKPAEFPRTGDK